MNTPQPSFGSRIRAYRLGYAWSNRHGAFIRIATDGPKNIIELAPASGVPKKTAVKEYRVWWEQPQMLDMIPWLRGVRRIKKPVRVEVDDNGEIVRSYT
jgi:hypothetical protein